MLPVEIKIQLPMSTPCRFECAYCVADLIVICISKLVDPVQQLSWNISVNAPDLLDQYDVVLTHNLQTKKKTRKKNTHVPALEQLVDGGIYRFHHRKT